MREINQYIFSKDISHYEINIAEFECMTILFSFLSKLKNNRKAGGAAGVLIILRHGQRSLFSAEQNRVLLSSPMAALQSESSNCPMTLHSDSASRYSGAMEDVICTTRV